ncbi:synaptogyrin 2 S homeolog [Xenopus laevis]|uniref:Synaptogyrin n=2 Tax=Xenopus laevis TaxID=8355 RepID=Q6AZR4_XENLA|nr:synaptogyrin 2 S homeolog [Xenopus laevis]AAH77448.1 Syngr2-prov protein [Xenopus laevis]OCT60457.1 hypothetical protein XELAEV_18046482mg [Xenopus laevis]
MENGAYGAPKAGSSFNLENFLRRPETILRICSCVFALVVFACIVTDGYSNNPGDSKLYCVFNKNNDACHYGVGIGFLAFLACILFLFLDIYLQTLSNVNYRKYIVLGDLGFSVLWSFLWFVGFCFLANQWAATVTQDLTGRDSAQSAIAFSFFSILSWIPLAVLAYKRYKQGADFNPDYVDPTQDTSSYPSYPASDNYQSPPFTNSNETGDYQPPLY